MACNCNNNCDCNNNLTTPITEVTVTDVCNTPTPTSITSAQDLEQLRATVEAQRIVLCNIQAGCLDQAASTTYFQVPFRQYFYNLTNQDTAFTVATGSLDATAIVEGVEVDQNGTGLPETGGNAIAVNSYSYVVNGTNIDVTLTSGVGNTNAPEWVLIKGYTRVSLAQLSGC